jgi:hypothetical protein
MKMCLHQFMRPKMHFAKHGVGDCTQCTPDAKNSECAQYCPITIATVEVKNGKAQEEV